MNQVVEGFERVRTGLHVCRGNWSKREDVLLTGDYTLLVPAFDSMNVDQFVLEYATPRAGELAIVGTALNSREIGLGVVNPRTDEAEKVESIIARAEEAMEYYNPNQIFLNPDCGFGCFANRCVNTSDIATRKLVAMVQAAKKLRERHR